MRPPGVDRPHLVYVPVLRSSVLERNAGRAEVRYGRTGRDVDQTVVDACCRPAAGLRLLLDVARRPPVVLEVSEPMWFRAWPYALVLGLIGRLRGSTVVALAIENLPLAEGFGARRLHLPHAVAVLLRASWRRTARLPRLAYGTEAARANYAAALGSADGPVFAERIETCACWDGGTAAEPLVLFLAEVSRRKGIDDLRQAWETAAVDGWRLVVCGFGAGADAVRRWVQEVPGASLEVLPERARVHELLRAASVVVLPSVSVPGWREQVGLSLLEGAAHGCRLVCSADSGAAEAVARGGGLVVSAGDVGGLVAALRSLAADGPGKRTGPRVHDSRVEFEAWAAGMR